MRCFVLAVLLTVVCTIPAHAANWLDARYVEEISLNRLLNPSTNRYCQGDRVSRFPRGEGSLDSCFGDFSSPVDHIFSRRHAYIYRIQPGDTLARIARRHNMTLEHLRLLNRKTDDHLVPGRSLWVSERMFQIEIDRTLNRLYVKYGGIPVRDFPVSTGRKDTETPPGVYFIHTRYPFPTWFHKGDVVSAASADNYLGSRWLGFERPQLGIHGTIFPDQIGRSVSKGCVRMLNEHVEELYEFIPPGTPVIIRK